MANVFSTYEVHPRDRLTYWREVATKAFVGHEFASPGGASFLGAIRSGCLGRLGVSTFECDPCQATRTARNVARCDSDDILLCLQVAGKGIFEQDGRQVVNEPGSLVLLDARRPFSSVFPSPARATTFKISRPIWSRAIAALTARSIKARGAVAGLASGFLSMLPARLDLLDDGTRSKLAEQALDLVALAFTAELQQNGVVLSSARAMALLRLKTVIEARLSDAELKPAAVAFAAGISVRYANDLLSHEGLSIERYIQHRRLERCRRALEDPLQARRMIGEIAFSWGFSNLSHFARRFRAEYGFAPSDYRRRTQEGGSDLKLSPA
jgi:AraC-like DNA-binding protein